MDRRAAIILVLLAGLGGANAVAGCIQPFVTGTPGGSTTTSGSTGGSPSSGSSASSAASSSGDGTVCDMAHPGACASNRYCLIPGCTGKGNCVPITDGANVYAPLCGCDGVSYWNATVASGASASIRATDRCTLTSHVCTPGSTVCAMGNPPGSCNLQLPANTTTCTGVTAAGSCWVLPSICSGTPGTGFSCTANKCLTQCDLIKAEQPWYQSTCVPQ